MARFRALVVVAAVAACSGKSKAPVTVSGSPAAPSAGSAAGSAAPAPVPVPVPDPVAPPAGTAITKITLVEAGLEPASLDRTVDPCVDFFQFACGGWLSHNDIPEDRARWARFSELDEHNNAAIKALLEEDASNAAADPGTKKLGDFYGTCMDEAAIEKAGTASIKPLLDRIAKVKDAKSWNAVVAELHRAGIPVVWGAMAAADLKDSTTNVTQLDSDGLGLPDRDYYVKPDLKDKVDAYRVHVARMLELSGMPHAKAESGAADVLAIETELAKLTKTGVERRDPAASYNPTDTKALAKQVKSVDWKAYWKALDVTPSAKIIVGTPKYFAALDGLRTKFKPAVWTSYFTYHLVEATSFALPKAFDDEAFELQKTLTGVAKQQERSKRCVEATQGALGELLGQQYADKYFPGAAKQQATAMVDAIVKAMGEEIGQLDWMSDTSKQTAQAKLAKIVRMIGYPEKWRVYDFEVKRGDFAGNELRAQAFETHRVLARSGKPVDRGEWLMNTYEVNAYYEPTANNTALPAGILQPPFFGASRQTAANLGGIGMVIGHELTHGFDDEGSQFDGDGNLKNWWTKDDKDKFDAKATCVADQYSTFEATRGGFVNGRLTLGEDIADLGGVKTAFRAYRALRAGAPKTYVADGFTEDQQFFIAVGQAWCSKDRPDEIKRRLVVDPHAPPKFRVYGALRNFPEFAAAFQCAEGTPMRPAKTCSVW
jgi:putative endopeptidase